MFPRFPDPPQRWPGITPRWESTPVAGIRRDAFLDAIQELPDYREGETAREYHYRVIKKLVKLLDNERS